MSKLSKEDFDDYLGKESFYSERDKERFLKKYKDPEKRRKNWFPQLASMVVILGGFFAGLQFIDMGPPSTSNMPDHQRTHEFGKKVDSMEDVEDFYNRITPGLEKAEDLGLVTDVDKTIKMENGSTLHIDRIWYNSDEILIFYSIGIAEYDGRIPPRISGLVINDDKKGRFSGQSLSRGGFGRYEGVIYNNRYYHQVAMHPIMGHSNKPLSEFDGVVSAFIGVEKQHNNTETVEVKLPLRYDKDKEPEVTLLVNKSIKNHDITVTLDHMNIKLTGTHVSGTVDIPSEDYINRIDGKLVATFKDGKELPITFSQPMRTENDFSIELRAFHAVPEKVTFTIYSLNFISDESVKFSMDVSDYEEKLSASSGSYTKPINKKVGESKNTEILLESKQYTNEGVRFNIVYKPEKPGQDVQLVADHLTIGDTTVANLPNVINATNEEGNPPSFNRSSIQDMQFSLELKRDFIKTSEQIDITLENLLYRVKFNEPISMPIPESASFK
ncbi:hypothetical protein ACFO3D_09280 [Virgibacillus kekensis]|uniref:DUF4179 domain-containing protein n=1 Tax=Virgibacillus kekensis TaxID=202261 RepID=A0ABV9DLC7_9BACI